MHRRTWQKEETQVCQKLGGERRGPDQSGRDQTGKNDCVDTPGFSVEVKLTKSLQYSQLWGYVDEAKAAASKLELPIAVVRKPGESKDRRMVLIDFEDFWKFYGGVAPGWESNTGGTGEGPLPEGEFEAVEDE